MNRKQRRAEKFNHFSESRKDYQPKTDFAYFPFLQRDIDDAEKEMGTDVLNRKIANHFESPDRKADPEVVRYRTELFRFTH